MDPGNPNRTVIIRQVFLQTDLLI